jgi:hypothetical protein
MIFLYMIILGLSVACTGLSLYSYIADRRRCIELYNQILSIEDLIASIRRAETLSRDEQDIVDEMTGTK